MSDYKIHVKNETESRQAQKYFFALGCLWSGNSAEFQHTHMPYLYAYMDNKVIMHGDIESKFHTKPNQELTLDQLQDLYILHRNDVNDANHSIAVASDRPDYPVLKSSESVFYLYSNNNNKWVECKSINSKTTGLKPIQKSEVQTDAAVNNAPMQTSDLISGADALRALADGEKVEWKDDDGLWHNIGKAWRWHEILNCLDGIEALRIKPKTILINGIGVPAPNYHCPEIGQVYLYLDDSEPSGFTGEKNSSLHDADFNYGWWDSEEKIKQVVDALRKVFKGAI